jgi:dTDP-4-amino-4,6-dideoxygalactose transaminase
MSRPGWRVPLVDLVALHTPLRAQLLTSWERVLDSNRFILGSELSAFEAEARSELGVAHACGVSNGTDALVCALAALGIGLGHRVLTTPYTFFATASAILRSGAELCFSDIDPLSFNLCPEALRTSKPPAVDALVAVHLFGQPAAVAKLQSAWVEPPVVIEDAAQAFGARSPQGKVGSLGTAAAFSFFPGKPLGALGDAGLITTAVAEVDRRCRALRTHGRAADGAFHWLGGNYRLDELQAAALRVKLPWEAQRRAAREAHAAYYCQALAEVAEIQTPRTEPDCESAWSVFALRVLNNRDGLQKYLAERGIESAVYYPRPLHLEPALASLGYGAGDFPIAERAAKEVLALPVYAELTSEQRAYVVGSVAEFFGYAPRSA